MPDDREDDLTHVFHNPNLLSDLENGCAHSNIQPFGDGHYGRCAVCGDEGFPITAEAAGMDPDPEDSKSERYRRQLVEMKEREVKEAYEKGLQEGFDIASGCFDVELSRKMLEEAIQKIRGEKPR